MNKRYLGILLIVGMLTFGLSTINVKGANANIVGNPELTIPLTAFTPYSSSYKTTDSLINGKTIDLSTVKGFELLKTKTELDLSLSTFESDDVLLKDSFSLYDRPAYSKTFLNSTYEAGTATNTTIASELAVSLSDTKMVANATTAAAVTGDPIAIWDKTMAFDSSTPPNAIYTDTGDLAYMPLPNADIHFYVGWSVNHIASITAASYAGIELHFERAARNDYVVRFRSYQEAGDTGWSAISTSSASNDIIFSAYDADADFIGITFNLADLLSEDSADNTADIIGLNIIRYKMNFEGADEWQYLIARNVAMFSSIPAVTDNIDDDSDYDWNDAGNIAADMHDSDSDVLGTKITEGGTETYDWKIPLSSDQVDSMELLKYAKYLTFDGTARIGFNGLSPNSYSVTSLPVSDQIYYLTTLDLDFDFSNVELIDTWSNIFSWGNVQFNFTVDDSKLPFTIDWENNLYSDVDGNVLDSAFKIEDTMEGLVFKSAFEATTVSDESEVQYDITDPSTSAGDIIDIIMKIYTINSFSITGGSTDTGVGAGQPSGVFGFDSQTVGLIALAVLAFMAIWFYSTLPKKDQSLSGFTEEATGNMWIFLSFIVLGFLVLWFLVKPMF